MPIRAHRTKRMLLTGAVCCFVWLLFGLAVGTYEAKADGVENGFVYTVSEGKATITDYTGTLTIITIPDTLGGYTVTRIGNVAFSGKDLEEVEIPATVETIDSSAFYLNRLTKVTLHEGLKTIGAYAFSGIYSDETVGNAITEIEIPSTVEVIDGRAFFNNALTKVTLHEGLKSIGAFAFHRNAIEEIEIPASVEAIGAEAFYQNRLTKVTLHEGLKTIGTFAFCGIYYDYEVVGNALTEIEIPSTVEVIDTGAFYHNALTKVILHEGLKSINNLAFYKNDLAFVVIPQSADTIANHAYRDNPSEFTVIGWSGTEADDFAARADIPFRNITTILDHLQLAPNGQAWAQEAKTTVTGEPYGIFELQYAWSLGEATPAPGAGWVSFENGDELEQLTEGEWFLHIYGTGYGTDKRVTSNKFGVDRTLPTLDVTMTTGTPAGPYANDTWSVETVEVRANASDAFGEVDSITVKIGDEAPIVVPGATYSASFETDGIYQLTITATDQAGNESAPVQRVVKIGKSEPTVTVTATKEDGTDYISGTWTNQPVTVAATAEAGAAPILAMLYSTDGGGNWHNHAHPIELPAEDSNDILFKAVDEAGNETAASIQVRIDKTAPQIDIVMERSPSAEPYVNDTWSAETVEVHMDATDARSGIHGLTIQVNDDLPIRVTGAVYALPFETDGVYNLTITATDEAGNESAPVQQVVKISKSEPTVTVTAIKEDSTAYTSGTWTNQSVTVVASAAAGAAPILEILYSTDGGEIWHLYSHPIELTGEGSYDILFRALDEADNETAAVGLQVRIDQTAPEIHTVMERSSSAEPYVNDTWSAETVAVNMDVSDTDSGIHGLTIKVNDSLPMSVTGATYAMLFETDGVYRLTITATDTAGNESAPVQRVVKIAKSEPTLTVTAIKEDSTAYTSGTWTNQSVTLTAEALGGISELSVTTAVYYSLDSGATWHTYVNPIELTAEGSYPISFKATDEANNEKTASLLVQIDKTVPHLQTLMERSPSAAPYVNDTWSAETVRVNIGAADAGSGIHGLTIKVNDSLPLNVTGTTYAMSFETDGVYRLTVTATDTAGNESAAVQRVVKISKSELTLTLTATKEDGAAYASGTWTNQPVTVAAEASGGSSDTSVTTAVYYSLDGGLSWAPYTIPVRLTEAGSHTLAFYALDTADRRFTDQLNIHIDTTAPEIQFVPDGNDGQTIGNAVAAAVHVTDPCGGSACSGIANSFPVYVWSKLHTLGDSGNQADWAGFANGDTLIQSGESGTWYLHVRAVDRAGNSAAAVSKPFDLNKPNDGGGDPGGNPGGDPDGNNGGNPDENNDDHSGEPDTPGKPATPEQPAIPEQPGTQVEPACLGQEPFTDIAGHWGEASIIKAYCKHMIDGYPDGGFKPDRVVNRAEFTMMLYRLFQWESGKTVLSFSDLSGNEHWAKQAIAQATAAGVVSGYPDGSFRPEGAISRAEMAIMIAKALGLPADVFPTTAFNDDADIPAWAKNAVESIRQLGIVVGRGDNSFVSSGAVTRAEAAVILLRAEEYTR